MQDPKSRFSDRAENYARYRPGYSGEVLRFLEGNRALRSDSVVADVGSGTGILGALFLEGGYRVFGVEPNREMRQAAEGFLGGHPLFESVDGAAEDTTLADRSVDLIVVANALHWIEKCAARVEFSRILRPGGHVAIVWNVSRESGTPFLEAYTDLVLNYRTDGGAGGAEVYEMTEAFFDDGEQQGYETTHFPSFQVLDLEGLKGLVLSSSSMPAPGQPGSKDMLRDLEGIFRATESGGEVVMEYEVSVYCGRLR